MATTSILPTHWYYNTESGQLTQGNNLENLGNNLIGGAGWHELNISGSATEAQAAAAAKSEFPTGKTPTAAGLSTTVPAAAAAGVKSAVGDLLGNWTIGGVSGTNLVQRALKVIVGGVLVLFGVIHMTGVTGDVAKAVKGVPLPV